MKRARPISLAEFDAALTAVVRDYVDFVARSARGEMTPEETKEFATRHAAGRGALAHLDQLHKMAGSDDDAARAARGELLARARLAIGGATEVADDGDE
jgi:hypothetical protein